MRRTGNEKRGFPRKRTRASAWIIHGDEALECIIIDRSESGAGLRLREGVDVPDAFELKLTSGERIAAEVVWRSYPRCGVVFRRSSSSRSAG